MTFSLVIRDAAADALGGAVLTAGPCVGGYVLHGATGIGFVLTQGYSTNYFYGPEGLVALSAGASAVDVAARLFDVDAGRARRQMAVMDWSGATAARTGSDNDGWAGHTSVRDLVAAGNRLAGPGVLSAMVAAAARPGPLDARLLDALAAGIAAGGDRLGAGSAALKVCAAAAPPLDLRVDNDAEPLAALRALRRACDDPDYRAFKARLPVLADRGRS